MNQIINLINKRKLSSLFFKKPIPENVLEQILSTVNAINNHSDYYSTSIVVIKDGIIKKTLTNICDINQHFCNADCFIIFLLDLYKLHLAYSQNKHINSDIGMFEILLSAIDVGSYLQLVSIGADSLGIGYNYFDVLQFDLEQMSNLLDLPKYVVPIKGMCLGYILETTKDVGKLPLSTYIHYETYKSRSTIASLAEYNIMVDQLREEDKDIHHESLKKWGDSITNSYRYIDINKIMTFFKKQQFVL